MPSKEWLYEKSGDPGDPGGPWMQGRRGEVTCSEAAEARFGCSCLFSVTRKEAAAEK